MYLAKVEKKGRTKEELHQVIEWLTGFDEKKLHELIDKKVTFEIFFQNATINRNAHLITGVISGQTRVACLRCGVLFLPAAKTFLIFNAVKEIFVN